MLVNAPCRLAPLVALAAVSGVARAADTNVTTAVASAKIGAEFRAELNHDDNGLKKVEGEEPSASTTVQAQTAKLKLSGKIDDQTDYKFRFNLLNPDTAKGGVLDYGFATRWLTPELGVSIGKEKVMQGGWDTQDDTFKDHWIGAYKDNLVFAKFDNMVALHYKLKGQINLQFLNDVTTATKGEWNQDAHTTVALGWLGDLGVVSPIVDIGSYDNNKSRWVDVGVKTNAGGADVKLDVRSEEITHKTADSDGKATEKKDTAMAYTLKVAYEIASAGTPWVYVSSYEKKQYEDKDAGKKDLKVNTYKVDDKTGDITWKFDDNQQVVGLGFDATGISKAWTTYLAYVRRSGKFTDPVSGKDETKADSQVRLGVNAEL